MKTVDLAFEEFGKAGNPVLIILHGFFASSRNWRSIAEKLSASHHVYVPDQRNHGASCHHAIMDYPSMAADLLQFIESHKLNKPVILGHSMGGKIAMWFGLTNPDKIDKLIIADIAPKSYPHSFDTFIESLKALPLDQISNRKQADDILKPAISDPAYRQFLLQNLVLKESKYVWRVDLDIFQVNAANITAFPDSRHLSPFSGKCLVLVGEQSNFVQKADIDAMFPIADFVTIADAGHWLHVQQPIAFLSALKRFL